MAPPEANITPIVKINCQLFIKKQVEVWIKLDYMRHPEVQGNKWHKLKLNMKEAVKQKKTSLMTFGGAYSNHIASTAAMAHSMGFKSIGIIRGDELALNQNKWSHTLKQAHHKGMQFIFLSRSDYRLKTQPGYLEQLQQQHPQAFIIPEGGSNKFAIDGFRDFMLESNQQLPDWTHLYTAVGTGGTLAGITKYALVNKDFSIPNCYYQTQKQVVGVATLKNAHYLKPQINQWIKSEKHLGSNKAQWRLLTDYHHGGYAKTSKELKEFINWFEEQFNIPLDPIYTGKMLYAFFSELKSNNISKGSKVLLIHTGGLQGRQPEKASFNL